MSQSESYRNDYLCTHINQYGLNNVIVVAATSPQNAVKEARKQLNTRGYIKTTLVSDLKPGWVALTPHQKLIWEQ